MPYSSASTSMGATSTPSPSHTGSEYGRYTFHIPNSFARRPVVEDPPRNIDDPAAHGLYKAAAGQPQTQDSRQQSETDEDVTEGAQEHTAMLSYDEEDPTDTQLRLGWEHHPSLGKRGIASVLGTFSLLGAAVLLPFNTLITPTEYYRGLLQGSRASTNFMSWVLLTFNAATIVLGAHAVLSLHKTTPARRIYLSTGFIFVCLLLFTLFTTQARPSTNAQMHDIYFVLLLLFTFALAGSTAYLQNAVVALCSIFGARAMGIMLSGQGLIGVGISVVQLTAAYQNSVADKADGGGGNPKTTPQPPSPSLSEGGEAASRTATVFFAVSTVFIAIALATFGWLARSKVYRDTCREYEAAKQSSEAHQSPLETSTYPRMSNPLLSSFVGRLPLASQITARHILDVQTRVLTRAVCLLANFAITLSIFPALTARITSTMSPEEAWTSPLVFVAIHFLVFNFADMVGRTVAMFRGWVIRSEKWTVVCTALRSVFIPLFFACNVQTEASQNGAEASLPDAVFFGIVLLFGISNGLIATSIMISGPSSHKLSSDSERATAGAVLSFWLTLGLAAGSVGSFLITAWTS